jgi:hypothetical protein
MDSLPLPVIGWVFTFACAGALLLGAWMIVGVHRSGPEARRRLAARVLDDTILFAIWILGLAGGIGILRQRSWGAVVLEFFCWTLVVLILLSSWTRLRASAPPRTILVISIVLFAAPIIVFCAATVLTLRSEAARAVLGSA